MSLYLPISKKEAWRLYNQKVPVQKLSSWRDTGSPLSGIVRYEDLKDSDYFAIILSEQESTPFLKLRNKFGWTVMGAAGTFPTGMILTGLSFLPHMESLDNNYFYYRLFGIILLSITGYSLSVMWSQAKEETRLWRALFEKYQVSDWLNSWR